MTTIPSSLDVGEWGALSPTSWQLAVEDEGSRGLGLFYVTGSAEGWSRLSDTEPMERDRHLLSAIGELPLLRIGVIRGACRGLAAALAAQLHMVFAVVGPELDLIPEVEPAMLLVEEGIDATLTPIIESLRRRPQAVRLLARLRDLQDHAEVGDALFAEASTYSLLLAGSEFSSWLRDGRSEGAYG